MMYGKSGESRNDDRARKFLSISRSTFLVIFCRPCSFIGHSLGGLIARYAIGVLESNVPAYRDLNKLNFITLASPHGESKRQRHTLHTFLS
jgi:triacylglycerol esterase/lipase EstA (alpha/beta hydrolase family)